MTDAHRPGDKRLPFIDRVLSLITLVYCPVEYLFPPNDAGKRGIFVHKDIFSVTSNKGRKANRGFQCNFVVTKIQG
jgi:hypothetical protein